MHMITEAVFLSKQTKKRKKFRTGKESAEQGVVSGECEDWGRETLGLKLHHQVVSSLK